MKKIANRFFNLIMIMLFIISGSLPALASPVAAASMDEVPSSPVVAKVYFESQEQLNALAAELDIWEVNHADGYLLAMLSPERMASLQQQGFRVEIDQEKTDLLNQPLLPLEGQGPDTIPGYPCYRTVEETYADMAQLAIDNPGLAEWTDIGDSWDKLMDGGPAGYDIFVLVLTNESKPGPKPKFFLMAEIHAREYVTSETAARYAEHLVDNYGSDPDITWLLDYFEIHIVPMTNPDGRKFAEQGYSWRKNTDNDDGCTSFPDYGTDLNRNHSFKWDMGGSSDYPCDELYHGPSAGSEPEVQAIENYVVAHFPDQRGPGDFDMAPLDSTGTFISLHSYSQLVLWPWGWSYNPAPNNNQLRTLGRKFTYFNNYEPQQSVYLYPTSGTSDEWAYGVLGLAGYTFEMGTTFFQGCTSFENTIYPSNLPALIYAAKSTRRPYMTPSGPDSIDVNVNPETILPGDSVLLTATADDTRYGNQNGSEPTQNIYGARYSIDDPSWITGTLTYSMTASDGAFNEKNEGVQADIDTSELTPGRHTIFVEARDINGNWGAPGAVFLWVDVDNYGVQLLPSSDSSQADPGQTVTYTLEARNIGLTDDTYTVTLQSEWAASAPAEISVVAGTSDYFDVQVTIPPTATNGESDTATITVTSQGDPLINDSSTLLTTANYYDLALSPASDDQAGLPGDTLTYNLLVTNTGNTTDTFDVIASGVWTPTVPGTLGPVAAGESLAWQVDVTIPASAAVGESDLATVTVTSQADATKSAVSELTTYAGLPGPAFTPPSAAKSGDPGTQVTYTLTITNGSAAADTYTITMDSAWETVAPTTTGVLNPGEEAILNFAVTIPADAMAGETDTAVVMAESADPLIIAAQAELATTANALFGLTVTPESASKLALAGFDVTYAVQVTNTGNTTGTFTLAISSTWDTEVPTSTQPLAAGESAMVTVVVHVPVGATAGEADTASLTVASVGDPAQTALVALTTQVGYGQYLPVTLKQ